MLNGSVCAERDLVSRICRQFDSSSLMFYKFYFSLRLYSFPVLHVLRWLTTILMLSFAQFYYTFINQEGHVPIMIYQGVCRNKKVSFINRWHWFLNGGQLQFLPHSIHKCHNMGGSLSFPLARGAIMMNRCEFLSILCL